MTWPLNYRTMNDEQLVTGSPAAMYCTLDRVVLRTQVICPSFLSNWKCHRFKFSCWRRYLWSGRCHRPPTQRPQCHSGIKTCIVPSTWWASWLRTKCNTHLNRIWNKGNHGGKKPQYTHTNCTSPLRYRNNPQDKNGTRYTANIWLSVGATRRWMYEIYWIAIIVSGFIADISCKRLWPS